MPIEPHKTLLIANIAGLLYDFLPANPHPYANQEISFPGCASKVGVSNFWPGGSKRPAVTKLLTETYTKSNEKFCPLILSIVNTSLIYRNGKNPIKRTEIEELNKMIQQVGFKIPQLWNTDFLESLEATPKETIVTNEISKDILDKLREEYIGLPSLEPQRRGYSFQDFLNKFFMTFGLKPHSAFRIIGEEIDGSLEITDITYLVEAKWQAKATSESDLLVFKGKVDGKASWARGIFISFSGFTKESLEAFARGKSTNIIGIDGQDIFFILEGKLSLIEAIKRKARRAAERNEFFISVYQLMD